MRWVFTLKLKTCKACKSQFTPIRQFQVVCNTYTCAIAYANIARERQNKKDVSEYQKEKKERLQALKTKSDWLKEAQVVYNAFVRLRDAGLNCISCDKPMLKKINCGHYRTVKAAPHLRFDERNTFSQCEACNTHLSGNIVNYRINMIKRVGIEQVEAVESDNVPKHYTIDDIKDIKLFYKAKIKEITK